MSVLMYLLLYSFASWWSCAVRRVEPAVLLLNQQRVTERADGYEPPPSRNLSRTSNTSRLCQ